MHLVKSFQIFLLFLIGFAGFSFQPLGKQNTKTDEQLLIELILHRGLLEEDKVPDHHLFDSGRKFYLSRRIWEKAIADPDYIPSYFDHPVEYFPRKVGKVKIVALTDDELQERANKKGDFLHLWLSDIKIEGNRAEIGLSTEWVVSEYTRGKVYMSGGGYILEYVKENGVWKFSKELRNWVS